MISKQDYLDIVYSHVHAWWEIILRICASIIMICLAYIAIQIAF